MIRRNLRRRFLGLLAVALGVMPYFTSQAEAGVITFTDRNAWRVAAGGGSGDLSQDFNSYSGTTVYGNPTGIQAGFLHFSTVSGNFGADTSWSIRSAADLAGSKTVNGTSYVSLVSYSPAAGDTLITTTSLRAFGFDYSGPSNTPANDANPLSLITSVGTITGPTILGSSSGFFGFVYTAGESFTSIEVRDFTDNRTFFGADNFEAYSTNAAPVPAPGALALLGLGLCGLAAAGRRKHARN